MDDTSENEAIACCEERRAFIIIELEKGIQIEFSGSNFKVGDYWGFYARTATGEIEDGTSSNGTENLVYESLLSEAEGARHKGLRTELQGKHASYALCAIYFYLTAVGADDDFALVQPDADAFLLCGLEWLEQMSIDKFL